MTTKKIKGYKDAIEFYGSVAKLGKAFRPALSRQAVNNWQGIIPESRCYQLEVLSKGRGKFNFKAREYLKSEERAFKILQKEQRLERAAARKKALSTEPTI